ncbi:ABC transporter permease [Ruminococcaceae bacterium OttesenSCG-928-A16]|nr:ABC transporter permease [Ruminococcaceae bacterium OttesenSCG-928-A16]
MREIRVLTGRTMKLYLKNPLSILFSFVYMLLFIVLISMFLGDYMAKGMMEVYAGVEGMDFSHIRWLVDTTSMAGVLMINCILVPLNVLTIMVQDSSDNRLDSFLVSAVSRDKLVIGYWLAPFLVGIVMNTLCFFISQGFIMMNGGAWLGMQSNIEMIGLIVANTFSATSILFVVAMLMKNASLYSTFTGIMSALVGFITGAFLPIGMFPANIQKIFAFIPAHHGATMMREVMTKEPLAATFGGVADQTVQGTFMTAHEIVDIYAAENGITYMFGNTQVTFPIMLAVVIGSGLLFLVFSIFWMKRYKKH